jgi:hypothetical protein
LHSFSHFVGLGLHAQVLPDALKVALLAPLLRLVQHLAFRRRLRLLVRRRLPHVGQLGLAHRGNNMDFQVNLTKLLSFLLKILGGISQSTSVSMLPQSIKKHLFLFKCQL